MVFPKLSRIFPQVTMRLTKFQIYYKNILFIFVGKGPRTEGLGGSDLDRQSVWYLENDIDRMIQAFVTNYLYFSAQLPS